MDVHVAARCGGKSTRALAWLALDPARRVLVTPTTEMARVLLDRARAEHPYADITERNFVTFRSAQHALRGRRRDTEVYVEDVDQLLAVLFGAGVAAASATGVVVDTRR